MLRLALFCLHILFNVIAHPLINDLDHSSLSMLSDEASSFYASPDDPDLYAFDLFDDGFSNDGEASSNSVQQDPYIWEPLVVNEPVSGVSLSAIEETDSSNDQIFEEFQSKELELSSIIQSMGNLCARGSTTPANGAVCHWEPQCENGRLAMCCSRKTAYGRPTDCTRYDPRAFKCTSDHGEHVYCCSNGLISGIIGVDCVKW